MGFIGDLGHIHFNNFHSFFTYNKFGNYLRCMIRNVLLLVPMMLIAGQLTSQIQVVAHRGANKESPENTYAAAELCVEMGVAYVEVDVRMSADSVFFIMHDALVNRTTNGSGRLAAMTATEIRKLDAGSWFGEAFAGEQVPELRDYLEAMRGRIGVYLDVKDGDIERLVALLRSLEMTEEVFLWSGNDEVMESLAALAPELRLKSNARSVRGIRRAVRKYGASIIEVRPAQCNQSIQRFCAEKNLQLMVYTTRTDTDTFTELHRCSPDLVNIDDPRRFIALRENGK